MWNTPGLITTQDVTSCFKMLYAPECPFFKIPWISLDIPELSLDALKKTSINHQKIPEMLQWPMQSCAGIQQSQNWSWGSRRSGWAGQRCIARCIDLCFCVSDWTSRIWIGNAASGVVVWGRLSIATGNVRESYWRGWEASRSRHFSLKKIILQHITAIYSIL